MSVKVDSIFGGLQFKTGEPIAPQPPPTDALVAGGPHSATLWYTPPANWT